MTLQRKLTGWKKTIYCTGLAAALTLPMHTYASTDDNYEQTSKDATETKVLLYGLGGLSLLALGGAAYLVYRIGREPRQIHNRPSTTRNSSPSKRSRGSPSSRGYESSHHTDSSPDNTLENLILLNYLTSDHTEDKHHHPNHEQTNVSENHHTPDHHDSHSDHSVDHSDFGVSDSGGDCGGGDCGGGGDGGGGGD